MSTAIPSPLRREPQLAEQTVVVIGGSAGIGLETARLAHAEGAKLVLTARNPERLQHVARELTTASTVAFDASDFERVAQFFDELPPIDHLLLTGPGPYYASLADFNFEKARRTIEAYLLLVSPAASRSSRREQGSPGRNTALHGRHRWPPHGERIRSHFLDPLDHCHGFLRFIRFHKIRLTCSNSAANRGNSEIHSLDEPAAQRSGTRQQNVFPYHSGRQATAATPSARPGPGQGRSIGFQLRPASPDLKRPRLLAA